MGWVMAAGDPMARAKRLRSWILPGGHAVLLEKTQLWKAKNDPTLLSQQSFQRAIPGLSHFRPITIDGEIYTLMYGRVVR